MGENPEGAAFRSRFPGLRIPTPVAFLRELASPPAAPAEGQGQVPQGYRPVEFPLQGQLDRVVEEDSRREEAPGETRGPRVHVVLQGGLEEVLAGVWVWGGHPVHPRRRGRTVTLIIVDTGTETRVRRGGKRSKKRRKKDSVNSS
jgi:hypothetical protein